MVQAYDLDLKQAIADWRLGADLDSRTFICAVDAIPQKPANTIMLDLMSKGGMEKKKIRSNSRGEAWKMSRCDAIEKGVDCEDYESSAS
jgi:hypothetical protein